MTDKSALISLVADLRALGYGASDIARAVGRTPERIRQILRDLHLTRPHIRTVDDLPDHMRTRVKAWTDLQNANET